MAFMKLFISVSVIFFGSCNWVRTENVTIQYKLHIADDFNHSPREFLTILNVIQKYHPKYSKEEIGNLIVIAYQTIKKHLEEISVYEVAEGIKRFSKDKTGIDLKGLVTAYIYSQVYSEEEGTRRQF